MAVITEDLRYTFRLRIESTLCWTCKLLVSQRKVYYVHGYEVRNFFDF